MTGPTQETSVQRIYKECRFGRSDIDRLFAIAPEGIAPTATQVSTQRASTRYAAPTLGELISALSAANIPGVEAAWSNLSMEASDPSGARRVAVSIDNERTDVTLSGSDETWVYGQAARVQILLMSVGGVDAADTPLSEGRRVLTALWQTAAVAAVAFGAHWLWSVVEPYAGMVGIMAILLSGRVLSERFRRRANRPVLLVHAEVSRGSWWDRMSVTDKIAFVTMSLTGLGVIAAAAIGIGQIVFG